MISFKAERIRNVALGVSVLMEDHYGYCHKHLHIKLWLIKFFFVLTVGRDGKKEL